MRNGSVDSSGRLSLIIIIYGSRRGCVSAVFFFLYCDTNLDDLDHLKKALSPHFRQTL